MPRGFDPEKCVERVLWCGDGDMPARKEGAIYTRPGTRAECLKIGIGAGIHQERRKGLPKDSLQQIKFVGPVHEANFINAGIRTTTALINRTRRLRSPMAVRNLLEPILVRKGGGVDTRTFNAVCMYLYSHGVPVEELPECFEG